MTLGERIKSERIKKGISQARLGEILQITQQAVGRWEKNQSEPDTRALKEMANLFGISVDYLLGYNNFSPIERAAGLSETAKTTVTPLEDDLLYAFRKVGKKHGEEAQRNIIEVIEKMT